jgi:hypothetical protein
MLNPGDCVPRMTARRTVSALPASRTTAPDPRAFSIRTSSTAADAPCSMRMAV